MSINPSPLAAPHRLNNQAPGTQDYLSTTKLAGGDIIAVWVSPVASFDGTGSNPDRRVVLQRLDASGNETGPEVEIARNPVGTGAHYGPLLPQVTALADGGYAVTHVEAVATVLGYTSQIVLNQFEADGAVRATTVIPNPQFERAPGSWVTLTHTSAGTMTPIALEGGGVAVVWAAGYGGTLQYAGQTRNYVQHVTAEGALDGAARAITPFVASVSFSQDFHDWVQDAAPLQDGGYVVIYRGGRNSPGNDTDQAVIMAQTINADGTSRGTPVVIAEPESDYYKAVQSHASITALEGGGFVVVWNTTAVGIEGRMFDATFNPTAGVFAAVPPSFGGGKATLSPTRDEGFIVTHGNAYVKRSFRYDADGTPVGEGYEIAKEPFYPGVFLFGGNNTNSPGHWEFAEDGTGLFFIVGESRTTSSTGASNDVWIQRFRPEDFGTDGNDTLAASDAGMALRGMGGNDRLEGGAGDDHLHGGDGADTLLGGAGNDTLQAGLGNDWLDGGPGNDLAILPLRVSGVTVTGPAEALVITHAGGQITVSNVETFLFAGGAYPYDSPYSNDTRTLAQVLALRNMVLSGTNADETLTGGWGDDSIRGWGGNDVLIGGAGADTLDGGNGNDLLQGGDGDDVLTGGAGDDTVDGGAGHDVAITGISTLATMTVTGPAEEITLTSAMGRDIFRGIESFQFTDATLSLADVLTLRNRNLTGTESNDSLTGDHGDDILRGLGGNDRLDGDAGNDTLYGGDGADTLIGGDGDDFLYGGATEADLRDVIFGGDGNDYIDGGYGNDELLGGNGNDTILGGFGSDTLIGNAGDDLLSGGAGADVLFGGPGNDTLNGGFGFDRLVGGAGADRFFHQGVSSHGSDWIQDYNAAEGDVLVFGQAGATRTQFQVNIQTTPGTGSADVAEAFVVYRPTGQILWALVDGAGQDSINIQLGSGVFDLMA